MFKYVILTEFGKLDLYIFYSVHTMRRFSLVIIEFLIEKNKSPHKSRKFLMSHSWNGR